MKGIIVYKSTYGSTKQYAEWLKAETGYPIVDVRMVKNDAIIAADAVIIGCPILAHKPILANWIRKKWKLLKDKKVVLYTTSGTPISDPSLIQGFIGSLPEEISSNLKYFPQGGRIIFAKLKGIHRFMMNLGMKMEKDPKIREEMGKDVDNVNSAGLKPLLQFVLHRMCGYLQQKRRPWMA